MKQKRINRILNVFIVTVLLMCGIATNSNVLAIDGESEPILENGGFEADLDINDIQTYKAEGVSASEGKVRSGDYAIKVGAYNPGKEDEGYPLWFFNGGKGSVGLTIRNIEPNTKYRVTGHVYNETGVNMRFGVLDIEGYDQFQPGQLKSNHVRINNATTDWKQIDLEITSGPRTTELYAFALTEWTNTESGAGVFYVDDVTVEKLEKNNDVVDTTIAYDNDYIVEMKQDFPHTIPMIQSFTATENASQFDLDTKGQLIYADAFSYDKAVYFGEKMIEHGVIDQYHIEEIGSDDIPSQGIVVVEKDLSFEYPVEFQATRHEAYEISIENNVIVLNAEGVSGIQNGLMTLLQAFKQVDSLPTGKVEDYTTQQIRGLQVDTGRRYYSMEWLKNQVEQMAYQKLNKLQLRLKDNEGIRYDSQVAPQFVDTAGGYWTEEEVKDLIQFARTFEIEVIPEVDFPGHSEQDGVFFPKEWLLHPDADDSRALDFSLPEVREYMASVYKEAFDLFESDIIHMGADEYFQTKNLGNTDKLAQWAKDETGNENATAKDAYKLFFNELAKPYLDEGKTVLLWNDNIDDLLGPAVKLDDRITIDYWASTFYTSISVDEALENGYQIMGSAANLYHDLWPENDKLDRPLPTYLFDEWTQNTYSTGWGYKTIAPNNLALGQMFPIWDDAHGYVSEYILTRTLFPRLSIFSDLMWGADRDNSGAKKLTFSETERLIYQLGTIKDEGFEQIRMDYTLGDVLDVAQSIQNYISDIDTSTLDANQISNVESLKEYVATIIESNAMEDDRKSYEIIFDMIQRYENLLSKEPVYGTVTVAYVDLNGSSIATPQTLNRDELEFPMYELSPIEIEGYTFTGLKEGSDSEAGVIGNKDISIVFEYKENPTDPTEPTEPTDPTDPTTPTDPKDPNKPETKPDSKLPSTGISNSNAVVMASILITLGLGLVFISKRRKNKNAINKDMD